MRPLLAVTTTAIMFVTLGCDSGAERRQQAAATAPWNTTFNVDISRALAKNDATGCGEYRYQSINGDSEYLVECFDGYEKRFYQVWPKIESVVGPLSANPY